MLSHTRKGFSLHVLIAGVFVIGIALPAVAAKKESIIGKVSSVDESTGTIMIINDLVEADANDAKIRRKGVHDATISDIADGDVVRIKGSADRSGIIQASQIKDPVKLKGYDAVISGTTKGVNTSAKTFSIVGQKVNAESLSGITMSGKTISFSNMRSGVSVDVYVNARGNSLIAQQISIRSESCTYCHGKR